MLVCGSEIATLKTSDHLSLNAGRAKTSLDLSDSCALSLVPAHPQKGLILRREGPFQVNELAICPLLSPKDVDVPTRADSILKAVLAAAFCLSGFRRNRHRMKCLYTAVEAMPIS